MLKPVKPHSGTMQKPDPEPETEPQPLTGQSDNSAQETVEMRQRKDVKRKKSKTTSKKGQI